MFLFSAIHRGLALNEGQNYFIGLTYKADEEIYQWLNGDDLVSDFFAQLYSHHELFGPGACIMALLNDGGSLAAWKVMCTLALRTRGVCEKLI